MAPVRTETCLTALTTNSFSVNSRRLVVNATDIIESMWGGLGKPFYINTANRGAVTNMTDDAYLELRCDVDMSGPRPQPVGPLPRGLTGLTRQVLDTHELTAQAAAEFDREALRQAMLVDPIVNSTEDAEAIIEETFARQKDGLDPRWYRHIRRPRPRVHAPC